MRVSPRSYGDRRGDPAAVISGLGVARENTRPATSAGGRIRCRTSAGRGHLGWSVRQSKRCERQRFPGHRRRPCCGWRFQIKPRAKHRLVEGEVSTLETPTLKRMPPSSARQTVSDENGFDVAMIKVAEPGMIALPLLHLIERVDINFQSKVGEPWGSKGNLENRGSPAQVTEIVERGEPGEPGEPFSTLTHTRTRAHAIENPGKGSPGSPGSPSPAKSNGCAGEPSGEPLTQGSPGSPLWPFRMGKNPWAGPVSEARREQDCCLASNSPETLATALSERDAKGSPPRMARLSPSLTLAGKGSRIGDYRSNWSGSHVISSGNTIISTSARPCSNTNGVMDL